MKRNFILLGCLCAFFLNGAEMIWKKEALSQWKALRNVKTSYSDGILKLYDIQRDPQVNSPVVNLDPSKYNAISITYRATGTPRSGGEFYFVHNSKSSIAKQMWYIPALKADGQWHTAVLTEKSLRDPELWFKKGLIQHFRLDITNAPGGTIEISEIRIFYRKSAAAPKKASSKKAAVKSSTPQRIPQLLDEPEWKPVRPEFSNFSLPVRRDPYFQGMLIKSPADTRDPGAPGKYYLRREFTLKAKPVRAWIQFTADDMATASINGTNVETNQNWRIPTFSEVSKELRAGKNVLGFSYKNTYSAGGVFGELYVEYQDGSFERINTDDKFVSSVKTVPDWDKAGGKCDDWQKVITIPGAPNPPWVVRLAYLDFSKPQHLSGIKLFNKSVTAGEKIKFRFDFKGKCPALPFHADIILTDKEDEVYKETVLLTDKEIFKTGKDSWKIETSYAIPLYMSSRKLLFSLKSGAIFCKSGGVPEFEFDVKKVNSIPGYSAPPVARIVKQNGSPQIQLNGKPFYMVWGGVAYSKRPDRQARHSDAPLNVVTVYSGSWWPAMDKINTACFDNAAENYRRNAKDAWFIWDLSIYPPAEFAEKYPSEMCQDDKGKINRDGRLCFSFASKFALERMRWALAQAITYLENAPYANRIIGYRINSGHTIEWLGWDPAPNRTLDFSKPATEGFKKFAAKHYPQLKDTSVPSLAERRALDNGELLWDQKKHLKVIAYHDFYSNAVVDMMLPLLGDARKLAGKNKLLGTYYGYVMTLHGSGASQMRAHYATKRLLSSGALDFLMSPQAYSVRQIGDFVADMKPFRSMQNNNIIPVIEDDTRTHIGPFITFSNNYQTHTEAQTIAVMRRNMGVALCRNQPCYYYALTPNSGMAFDFPAMAREIAAVRKVGEHTLLKARRNAEIAYVVSEETIKSMPMLHKQAIAAGLLKQRFMPDGSVSVSREGGVVLSSASFQRNYTTLARLGAPVDYILAEDLKDNPGNYKLYIFINAFKYDAKFLAAVKKLQERKCTLLWVYAPGYTFDSINSTANMKQLTGLDLVKSATPLTPLITFSADGRKMGSYARSIAPMFSLKQGKGVSIWGKYEDGTAGLGARKVGNSLAVFCGPDQFDVKFLNDLARQSGVHIYSNSSDPIEANSSLLMLHARFPGKKIIDLPETTNVLDVYSKKIIARDVKRFEFNAPLHSTFLFYFGKDADQLLEKLR